MKGRQAPLFAPCSLPTMYFCRAQENGQLLGKVEKERGLLRQELFARVKGGQLFYKPEGTCKPVGL